MRTRDDIEAAKATYNAAITDADATSYPPGYISAITLTIDDKNVIVSPLTANIGGKTVTKTTDTNTADMNWRSDRIPSTTYYIYLGKYGVWYVDLTEPATLSGFYGQYHPTTGERYIGKFKLAADYSIYSVTVAGAVVGSGIEDGEVTADKVSTDFLQAVFAAITTLYVGYYGTGSYSSPDEGDQALLIEDAVIKLIKYLGGGWSDVNKMQMGKLSGALLLALFVGCGLVHPDADLTELSELIPFTENENVCYLPLDNSVENVYNAGACGEINAGTIGFSTIIKKFGTHSLYSTDGTLSGLYTPQYLPSGTGWKAGLTTWIYWPSTPTQKAKCIICGSHISEFGIGIKIDTDGSVLLYLNDLISINTEYDTALNISIAEWNFLGLYIDSNTNTLCVQVNGGIYSVVDSDITSIVGDSGQTFKILAGDGNTGISYIDDALTCLVSDFDTDIFIQHYLSNLPWSTEYSYADIPIIPAEGGQVVIPAQLKISGASRVIATSNAGQSIPNITYTTLIFEDEVEDNLSEYNTSNGKFTAKKDGYYQINFCSLTENKAWAAGKLVVAKIYVNEAEVANTLYYTVPYAVTAFLQWHGNQIVHLSAGDCVEIKAYHNYGSDVKVYSGGSAGSYNYLSIHRLS